MYLTSSSVTQGPAGRHMPTLKTASETDGSTAEAAEAEPKAGAEEGEPVTELQDEPAWAPESEPEAEPKREPRLQGRR